MKKNETSWGKVADWYDEYLSNEDSYQKAVILPNVLRVLEPKKGVSIVDLACGQGFFTEEMALLGADVIGVDISPELVAKAEARIKAASDKHSKHLKAKFIVSPADDLSKIEKASADRVVCVLAAQNIKELDTVFGECSRILKKGGKLVLVLNHPAFRIPKASDWHYEATTTFGGAPRQGRVVYQYLSEGVFKIDMNQGSTTDKKYTLSYHRPMQVFVKWLTKRGFAITRLEEWASHKKSQPGPKAKMQDAARKEIPMFMCIEATLL
jgi:ubiquinone/menaquinone biosynthesis C-methylase UbiE